MLRTEFPIFFNDTEIKCRRTSWTRDYVNVDNVNVTEAGTDDVERIRSGKASISTSFVCSDFWAAKFAEFNAMQSFELRCYDIVTKDYITMTVRMEDLSIDEVEYSDMLQGTNGLYTVSFTLTEF